MSGHKLYERKPMRETIVGKIALRFTSTRAVQALTHEQQIDRDRHLIEKNFDSLLKLIEEHSKK